MKLSLATNKARQAGRASELSRLTTKNMKINKATRLATARTQTAPVVPTMPAKPLSAAQAGKVAKRANKPATVKTAAVKPTLPDGLKWSPAIAILTGERGILARNVLTATDKKSGRVFVKATQNETGLSCRDAQAGWIEKGILCGDKVARVQLGGYVNGKNTGAKITLTTLAAFIASAHKCLVHWKNTDDAPVNGYYRGNPAEKGICAVYVPDWKFVWQMELDSNSHNRHERGYLKPVKQGEILKAC